MMWYIHTDTIEYYSATKKKEISPFATTRMLNEISQPQKDNGDMSSLTEFNIQNE